MRSEAFWIAAGRIGNALLLLVGLRVMTSLLQPADYGLLAILTAFQAFAGLVLVNPIGQYINRHTHEWYDDESLSARVRALSRYWLIASVSTGAVAAAWFGLAKPGDTPYAYAAVGLAVAFAIYAVTEHNVLVSRLNMLGRRRESVLWQLAATSLGLLFSAAITYVSPSALSWLGGQALGAWLAYLGVRRVSWRSSLPRQGGADVGFRALLARPDFKRFCLPLAAITGLMWLEGNGYRFLIERAWSSETFAFFVLGLSVPAQMSALLESIAMQLVYPYFFRGVSGNADAARKRRTVASMAEVLLPLYLLWAGFLIIGSPYALQLITDPKYHAATHWLIFGALAELARLTGNVWQLVAQAEKNFAPILTPFAIGAVGVLGAAVASAGFGLSPFGFAVLVVVALYAKASAVIHAMWRRMPIRLAKSRIALAVLTLLLFGIASRWLPTTVAPLSALAYLTLAFVIVTIPMAIHIKTSPGLRYLFSFPLRGDQ